MTFRFRPNELLPPLSWIADCPIEGAVEVACGPLVECGDSFFFEGAWGGTYDADQIASTEVVFGSGAFADGPGVTFVSSVATTDYLYYRAAGSRTVVSNSLPLLLAYSDDALDPAFDGYDLVNSSITRGFMSHIPDIPTKNGRVSRVMHRNLVVAGGTIALADKPPPPRFRNYSEYVSYLDMRCGLLIANARDRRRSRPLLIASTQSKGYDSTAVNVIARKYGIDVVFTVTKAKAAGQFADDDNGGDTADDDGTEICHRLGLQNVVALDRSQFKTDSSAERLLYATLDRNQDLNLIGIQGRFKPPALLLTGTLGEIWYPGGQYLEDYSHVSGAELGRWDLSMHGLTEFRLEAGFIQAPLIYLGARNREDIFAITASEEMRAWEVKQRYNRPIPRRIGEEAGLPRESFGQRKMATVVEFAAPHIPISTGLRNEYRAFLVRNRILRGWQWDLLPAARRWNTLATFTSGARHRLLYYAERTISKLIGKPFRAPRVFRRLNGRVFCFAANERAHEYRRALTGDTSASGVHAAPGKTLRVSTNV